jgi:hypothetical protein
MMGEDRKSKMTVIERIILLGFSGFLANLALKNCYRWVNLILANIIQLLMIHPGLIFVKGRPGPLFGEIAIHVYDFYYFRQLDAAYGAYYWINFLGLPWSNQTASFSR